MGEQATNQQVKNGDDYILQFEGRYDTFERRAELTEFVRQAFERMPELAQKVIDAKELNGTVPRIVFTEEIAKEHGEFKTGRGASTAYFMDNMIRIHVDNLENIGSYDPDDECVKQYPLVLNLAHELAHVADPEAKEKFSQLLYKTNVHNAMVAKYYQDRDTLYGAAGSDERDPPTEEQLELIEKEGLSELSLSEVLEYIYASETELQDLNVKFVADSEPTAVAFEDEMNARYGSRDDLSERSDYANGYLCNEFNSDLFYTFISDSIGEGRLVVTGCDCERVMPDKDVSQFFPESKGKYPKDAWFCSDEDQPDIMWLPK